MRYTGGVMPNYSKIRDMISHRIVIEYDTGARVTGTVANVRPNEGDVQLINLSKATIVDSEGNLMEEHTTLSICPNVLTNVALEEGPSGRSA